MVRWIARFVAVVALAAVGGVAWWQFDAARAMLPGGGAGANDRLPLLAAEVDTTPEAAAPPVRPLPPRVWIANQLRVQRLETYIIDGYVRSEQKNVLWRGTAEATIVAPVRYTYGVDLGALGSGDIITDTDARTVTVRIPRPQRLATEVDTANTLVEAVNTTGTRLRSRAGEFYLGLARGKLTPLAREQALSDEDLARIEAYSLDQVGALVQVLIPDVTVEVVYE